MLCYNYFVKKISLGGKRMKKRFLIVALFVTLLFPFMVNASEEETKNYESTNLKETLDLEEIDYEFKSYKETDDQVTIYMFRGSGCGFCQSFLNYLNSITDEYGKYFKLVAYEVWENSNNADLLDEVAEFLDEDAAGVPYIVIGDKVFPGYIEDWNQDIIDAIMAQYESDEKYDVMQEMAIAKENAAKEAKGTSSSTIIWWNAGIVLIATLIIISVICINNKKLDYKLEAICEKLNIEEHEILSDIKDTNKKELATKKVTNKTKESTDKKSKTKAKNKPEK